MPADRQWRVKFHREVEKIVAQHGIDSPNFRPTIADLVTTLETNPKQFAKKSGKLKDARAAELKFADANTWRAVFTIDETAREVRVLSIGPHDAAYAAAENRL